MEYDDESEYNSASEYETPGEARYRVRSGQREEFVPKRGGIIRRTLCFLGLHDFEIAFAHTDSIRRSASTGKEPPLYRCKACGSVELFHTYKQTVRK